MSKRAALVTELLEALRKTNVLAVSMGQAAAGRIGINTTDLHCLNLLSEGALTASELARRAGITTASVTGVIDRLEAVGYVRRERDGADRRKVVVSLVLERAAVDVAPVFTPLLKAWRASLTEYSDEELELIAGFMNRTQSVFSDEVEQMRSRPAN
ncbi:MarR family winged helix-turn-helix transcriptional regulator [Nonomuraea rhizosphaerae]|uniref:MarR family winged helix-turn-helix transcriptional regulator n=1 Tax=Nonomuraea rhizosphaerae TaxID=2665663 RepID=UPI001C5D8408|nr:MarR family transcriptional regulator [Nonomuraea rhizosphaerae]